MPRASGLYSSVVFLGGKTGLDFSLVDKCQVTSGTVWTQRVGKALDLDQSTSYQGLSEPHFSRLLSLHLVAPTIGD